MGCLKLTYSEEITALKVVYGDLETTEKGCAGGYRYGFNGMEKDDELAGDGNSYTTEFRQLDPRLGGRWWSPDPIVKPWESPYAGFANNPILFVDPEGLNPGPGDGNTESSEDDDVIYDGGTLPEVVIKPTPKEDNAQEVGGGVVGGLALDFMIRDRIDFRNSYYNPNVSTLKDAWKSGAITDGEYAMSRYKLQAETKAMYKSAISKAMGELPPTGKPLWQQKKLAEDIASGARKISSNAGNTRGLTTKLATQTATKVIGRTLVVTGAAMSVYTVLTAEDQAKALTSEASGWGAAWGGAAVGASWGAAIGGPFAPLTGAIGGVIGGGIGYYLGTQAGEAAYDAIKEY
jgi:RHS repeat-associated protein